METTFEKLGKLSAKTDAAHKRLDLLQRDIRDDLRELKSDLKIIQADIKAMSERINIGRGWAAAALTLSSIGGALLTKIVGFLLRAYAGRI